MKRFLLLAILIPHIIFAEDIYFKVIETTPAWLDINFPKPSNISGEILKGSIVKDSLGISFSVLENIYENIPFQTIIYADKEFKIYANSIIPLETKDLFDKKLLYNPDRLFVYSFFIRALLSNDYNQIYLYDKTGWDDFLDAQSGWTKEETDRYGVGSLLKQYVRAESMRITQTGLILYSGNKYELSLLIKSIIKIKDGYSITVKGIPFSRKTISRWWKWSIPEEKEFFTILLVLDGDYIDLYLENKNSLIETFVFVNKEIATQIDNLILGFPVDLSKITSLPRRADGSTDYRLPVSEPDVVIVEETKNTTVSNEDKNQAPPLPLWAWVVFIGIAVAVSGGVAVFVVKRKK